jgi:tetratricopeptide (TPR) repeat protein
MDRTAARIERLVGNLRWALDRALPSSELLPMLEQLLDLAPRRSAGARLATHHLSRLIVASQPWRAARLAQELLANPTDGGTEVPTDHVWATLGIAQTVMGNYRSARQAHLRALQLAPREPSHLHNLGHLIDVAFGKPEEALRYLQAAHDAVPEEPEIASSYAHALVRAGMLDRAREVLQLAISSDAAEAFIARWGSPGEAAGSSAPAMGLEADADLEVAEA